MCRRVQADGQRTEMAGLDILAAQCDCDTGWQKLATFHGAQKSLKAFAECCTFANFCDKDVVFVVFRDNNFAFLIFCESIGHFVEICVKV